MALATNGLVVLLSDASAVFCANESDYQTMARTAKKKEPAAADSQAFKKLTALSGSHAAAVVVHAPFVLDLVGDRLQALEKMNPKGVEALRKMQTASLTADWDLQPKLELAATIDNQEGAKNLAEFANASLQMLRTFGAAGVKDPAAAELLKTLEAKTDAADVKLAVEYPKAGADQMLDAMEKKLAELPEDPAQRQAALGELMTNLAKARGR